MDYKRKRSGIIAAPFVVSRLVLAVLFQVVRGSAYGASASL